MTKVAKKIPVKKVVTVEELNKPSSAKKGHPKPAQRHCWFKAITLLLLSVIAASSSYIAYELKNTSYRISVIAQYE